MTMSDPILPRQDLLCSNLYITETNITELQKQFQNIPKTLMYILDCSLIRIIGSLLAHTPWITMFGCVVHIIAYKFPSLTNGRSCRRLVILKRGSVIQFCDSMPMIFDVAQIHIALRQYRSLYDGLVSFQYISHFCKMVVVFNDGCVCFSLKLKKKLILCQTYL